MSSEYKISNRVPQRVMNYRMSVKSKSDPEYRKLKESVEEHNRNERKREELGLEPHYLRVRGRGRNPTKKGFFKYSVPDDVASYFDVYVQRDTDAMHRYRQRTSSKKTKGIINSLVNDVKNALSSAKPA